MTNLCARGGCTAAARRRYCSHRCGSIEVARRLGRDHFRQLSIRALTIKRAHGRQVVLRPHEQRLMAAGRFREAAASIYDRGYGSGWLACRRGYRQLPARSA